MASLYSTAKQEMQNQMAAMKSQLPEIKNYATSYASTKAQEVSHNVMDHISAKIPNGVNLSHFQPVQGRGKKGKKGGVKEEWEEEPDPYDEYKGVLDPPEEVEKTPDPYALPDGLGNYTGEGESKPKKAKKSGCLPCKANEAHGGAWKMKKKRAKSRSRSRSRPKSHSKNKK